MSEQRSVINEARRGKGWHCQRVLWFLMIAVIPAVQGLAGMPSVLPEDIKTVLRLNEEPHQRLQAISFFVAGILLSSFAVKLAWNHLQKDFTGLPRMTFGKAVSFVLLCGSLFVIVLTMISGARELMTPKAWKKDGITYQLQHSSADSTATADGGTSGGQ